MNKNKNIFIGVIIASFCLTGCGNKRQDPINNDDFTVTDLGNKIVLREKENPQDQVEISLLREKNVLAQGFDSLSYANKVNAGDIIQIKSDYKYVLVDLFEGFEPALLYLPHGDFAFKVPSSTENVIYPTSMFAKTTNTFVAHKASQQEIEQYSESLSYNPYDFMRNDEVNNQDVASLTSLKDSVSFDNDEIGAYPHAYANRVTRNEVGFYARNAIDGLKENEGHGNYPYQSWGYNQKADAEFTLYFGREINVDTVDITLRADYSGTKEHDTYWDDATLEFSNGETEVITLEKGKEAQHFEFDNQLTEYIKIKNIHAHTSTTSENYAALTEIEVSGDNNFKNEPIEEKVYISEFGGKKLNSVSTSDYHAEDIKEMIEMTNDWFINITETTNYTQPDSNGSTMQVKINDSLWKDAVYYSGITDYYLTSGN